MFFSLSICIIYSCFALCSLCLCLYFHRCRCRHNIRQQHATQKHYTNDFHQSPFNADAAKLRTDSQSPPSIIKWKIATRNCNHITCRVLKHSQIEKQKNLPKNTIQEHNAVRSFIFCFMCLSLWCSHSAARFHSVYWAILVSNNDR